MTSVRHLEKSISYRFVSQSIAELALTHRSAARLNNERMEFLGDAILGFLIADELSNRFPEAPEGLLSRQRALLVNQQTLATLASQLQLGDLLVLGPGELKSGGRKRESILADAMEAVIGAVYQDGGLEVCRAVVLSLYNSLLGSDSTVVVHKDSKTRLQELLQSKSLPLPVYQVVSIGGEEHEQVFLVSCQISLLQESTFGQGANRRLAEQQAATRAIEALGL